MKITREQLKEIIREEIQQLDENYVSTRDADKFISDVLKLGSKNNIFDPWMKKNGIPADELSMLVSLVAQQLEKKWG